VEGVAGVTAAAAAAVKPEQLPVRPEPCVGWNGVSSRVHLLHFGRP
jgi:hypothetical protein